MSEHYYTRQPTTASERHVIETVLRGFNLKFTSDSGVFSREGVDYGSRVLIGNMEIPDGVSVLDVGCGYGPIGITAALLAPNGRVVMTDINERALELARLNAEANGIRNASFLQSDRFAAVEGQSFDVILTNPPIRAGKTVVYDIFEGSYNHLRPGGSFWVVIQKKQGAPSAHTKLKQLFGDEAVEEAAKDKGYRIFRCKKSLT